MMFSGNIGSNMTSSTFLKERSQKQIKIIKAIAIKESNNNPKAINHSTNAVGVVQITPIVVKDLNRIYKTSFKLSDRYDRFKSYRMFCLYQDNYNPSWNLERAARIWNGGPNGHKKKSTKKYYIDVKLIHKKI